jgi:hypothetical protein
MTDLCTCPTKFDANGQVVRAMSDQRCPVHGQRQAQVDAARVAMEQNARRYLFLRAGGGNGLYVADGGHDWREVEGQALDEFIDRELERAESEIVQTPSVAAAQVAPHSKT